ncbi:hypothetical protein [Sedimenticola selenatireducens]|uniref:DUF4124 domain-containing protein n=1 Tax=Sedimenticola selenatireducens TaxID=191960 RepID=A0A557SM00_9GAMM|nr:hypothetical protein [Sedimenticola selenatireducens]TVO78443.1 hypothetical protein FHP88_01895 [Sedimenticola selenatireducens]TVT62698.1 MAG: hypothetical protein FHK78_13560 [Sedimenticola selenatireducens]
MNQIKQIAITLSTLLLIGSHAMSFAEECNYNWILANTDGSKATKEQYIEKDRREAECKKRVTDQAKKVSNARQRLKNEFKIDPSGMTDDEAIARLSEEQNNRRQAKEEAEARRQEAADEKRMSQIDQMMDKQNQMLKGLGVTLGSMGAGGASNDSDIDPAELQLYQQMVNNGVAPQCKGKQGEALIECVDIAVDGKQ